MRSDRSVRPLASAVCLAILVLPTYAAKPGTPSVDKASEAVLVRARRWAGGPALERIHSISITTRSGRHVSCYRFLPPDRYRADYLVGESRSGSNTIDGDTFWQSVVFPADVVRRARRNAMADELVRGLVYLLRPLGGTGISINGLGSGTFDGIRGDGISVRDPSGRETVFVFDSGDGHPLAYIQDGTLLTTGRGANTGRIVTELSDDRLVDGVRFPYRLVDRWASAPGESPIVEQRVENIELNTLTAADFKQPGRKQ